jgi:hypothetical protein
MIHIVVEIVARDDEAILKAGGYPKINDLLQPVIHHLIHVMLPSSLAWKFRVAQDKSAIRHRLLSILQMLSRDRSHIYAGQHTKPSSLALVLLKEFLYNGSAKPLTALLRLANAQFDGSDQSISRSPELCWGILKNILKARKAFTLELSPIENAVVSDSSEVAEALFFSLLRSLEDQPLKGVCKLPFTGLFLLCRLVITSPFSNQGKGATCILLEHPRQKPWRCIFGIAER